MTIIDDRLAALEDLTLASGAHSSFEEGHCAMEVVAWLAGQGHTDAPECASPVLRRYTIRLNDRWSTEKRQSLKPFLPRMVGTGGDGKDAIRSQIALRYLAENLLGPWLRVAGLDAEADALASVDPQDAQAIRRVIDAAYDAAWSARERNRKVLAEKIKVELMKQGKPADAVAVADAVAAAAAVADADADAVAVAAADAAVVAVAVADADAVAAVAAVAVAAVAAVAVAAVAVAAGKKPHEDTWSVAYRAARKYYQANPLPVGQQVADLIADQGDAALELLDLLIDAEVQA